jgi:CRP-like cAMP-binding protein
MEELKAVLQGVVLFQDLSEADLEEIASQVITRTFRLGEYLFHAGAERRELTIIKTGEVEILGGIGEACKPVARLGEGNFVGEGALLGKEPHATSCRAVVDCTTLSFDRHAIETFLVNDPRPPEEFSPR